MKFPNYLKTSLAIVGAVSLFIMACSADETTNSNNNTTVTEIGRYQITDIGQSTYGNFHVIDTETGVVKTFERATPSSNFVLIRTTVTQ